MKRGFLGPSKKEPAGLCTIRKSTREVPIDTLQAAAINNVHHQSIDTRKTTAIDRANQPSKNTVHPATVHLDTVRHEDPAHLERTIRKDQRSTSFDAAPFTSTDSHTQPSTDTRPSSSTDLHRSTSIDTTPRTSIDHQSQNMVAIVILRQDQNGNLYDQDGHQQVKNLTLREIPPPKPLANPPEPTTNPSDTTPEPMKVDEATKGRRLRKRKEKIPKNFKREANEKEMDGFTKRVLRIPMEKPFD
ncbi:hypothetical protein DY000_02040346 [Brassica cretica]|uniref:Shugoshin C-terminal domain-containing protein n=1 Tax=Brassica cretica TaxID=69181 RepID=A0ABQ7BGX9_BRACR|nr:hypothetical protein DY000_02040346 [Brassica cretica]